MSKYLPFKEVKVGQKFTHPESKNLCMKIACHMHDDGSTELQVTNAHISLGGPFKTQRVNIVALTPYHWQKIDFPAGDLGFVDDKWAVELFEEPAESDVERLNLLAEALRRERDVCAEALRKILEQRAKPYYADIIGSIAVNALNEAGGGLTRCA